MKMYRRGLSMIVAVVVALIVILAIISAVLGFQYMRGVSKAMHPEPVSAVGYFVINYTSHQVNLTKLTIVIRNPTGTDIKVSKIVVDNYGAIDVPTTYQTIPAHSEITIDLDLSPGITNQSTVSVEDIKTGVGPYATIVTSVGAIPIPIQSVVVQEVS